MLVGQNENICRFKIDFRLVIWNVVRPEQHPPRLHITTDGFPDLPPILVAVLRPTSDDQAIVLPRGQGLPIRSDEVFKTLVRCDVSKEKNRPVPLPDPQASLCGTRGE